MKSASKRYRLESVPHGGPGRAHRTRSSTRVAPSAKAGSRRFQIAAIALAGTIVLASLPAVAMAHPEPDRVEREARLIRPVKVVSTSGSVQNAEALVSRDEDGVATLTMAPGGVAPTIVLDYGSDVGGLTEFDVRSVIGTPRLQAIYSEAQQNLLPIGDGSYPDGPEVNVSYIGSAGAASLSRVNSYRVVRPGVIVSRLVQGAQRFQVVKLTEPGSITLRKVGVRPLPQVRTDKDNAGYFRSSDPVLDEIWALGANTVRLAQVPVRSLPETFTVTPRGLTVKGSTYSVYQAGTAWSNYSVGFDVKVVSNEAGWMVNAVPLFGYRFVLAANNDTVATPNTLRLTLPFNAGTVAQAPLPFDLAPGTWHRVRTVTGSDIKVYVDEQLVMTLPISGGGSFGFAGYDDTEGQFRNLLVSDANGRTLFEATLTDPAVLDAFAAASNREPSIMDAPKRDRLVWSGDLAVAGPTVYYSNGASDTIAGSLRLFGSFQRSTGQLPGVLPPQLRPGLAAGDAMPDAYYYSLSYSLHFVTTLADYYLYTGDKTLVRSLWKQVQNDIGYAHKTTNGRHLVVTDDSNRSSWHPHDPSRLVGAVTEFNALYYKALRSAGGLARAIGQEQSAASYEAEADRVRQAMNATLYNPATGLYDISDLLRGPVAQDANAMAVLYGVAPQEQRAAILKRMAARLDTPRGPLAFSPGDPTLSQIISPFISSFDAWARFESGDANGALALIRKVWGPMRKDGAYYSGGVWEALAPDGTPATRESAGGTYASLAHPWASGPTSALSKYVLGVRPLEAGFKRWLVEPQAGNLDWAQGRVPTPCGPIDVRWWKGSKGFRLHLTVPPGTRATVGLPAGDNDDDLFVDGRRVVGDADAEAAQTEGRVTGQTRYVRVRDLAPGDHQIRTGKGSD